MTEDRTVPPAPRLQFAWELIGEREIIPGVTDTEWLCRYQLVLPLREHDIRAEDENCKRVRNELIVEIGSTKRGSTREPCGGASCYFDAPFRDGVHAQLDSSVLGDLPIYCVTPAGEYIRKPEKEPTP